MPKGSEGFSLAKVGTYAFLLGVLVAIGTAFVPSLVSTGTATALLVVLGLLVGFLNVTQKETVPFLVAALALGLGSSAKFSTLQTVGTYLDAIMANMVTFVAPAAVIVALKAVYELSKEN